MSVASLVVPTKVTFGIVSVRVEVAVVTEMTKLEEPLVIVVAGHGTMVVIVCTTVVTGTFAVGIGSDTSGGMHVTMAGFLGMYGWQRPMRSSRDLEMSWSSLPHDCTQP
jgi:hypothetical protein